MSSNTRSPTGRSAPAVALASALLFAACGHDATEPVVTSPTGAIRITLSLTGVDLPPSYSVLVANRSVAADQNGVATVFGLNSGNVTVLLRVASNCQVAGENPRAARVIAGNTTAIAFSATCAATTGALKVSTATTGIDIDPDGYMVLVEGFNAVTGTSFQRSDVIAANGTRTFSVPVGNNRVTLMRMSVNCDPTDANPRIVSVPAAETLAVALTVTCAPATGELAYVIADRGSRHIYVINANGTGVRRLTSDRRGRTIRRGHLVGTGSPSRPTLVVIVRSTRSTPMGRTWCGSRTRPAPTTTPRGLRTAAGWHS